MANPTPIVEVATSAPSYLIPGLGISGGDIIKALIASPWPWLALIAVIVLSQIKKPVVQFLSTLKRAKISKDGVDLSSSYEEAKPLEEKKEAEVPEKSEEDKKTDEQKEDQQTPTTYEGWRMEMIFASFGKDKEPFEHAFVEMQKLSPNALTKKKDEILHFRLQHQFGDTQALSALKELLKDPEIQFEATMAVGLCYENSEDYVNANRFFAEAAKLAKNDQERVRLAFNYPQSLYKDGRKEEAIAFLDKTLSEVSSDEKRADIYKVLGDIYEKEKDFGNRAFVLDKALELKPNDSDLLFGAAYSYSQVEYGELSLFHYINAEKVTPDGSGVYNNLGVQYESLKMPAKSIESYEKAEKQGLTLAAANLAYRLMSAGFIEEAAEKLNIAKTKDDPHPNVSTAISDLAKKKEEEDNTEKEAIKEALVQRKFFISFAEAKHILSNKLEQLSGTWKSDPGTEYFVEIKNKIISITWTTPGYGDSIDEFKVEGAITNNSAEPILYKKGWNDSFTTKEYQVKKDKIYVLCSADGNDVWIMDVPEYGAKKIHSLKKS